MLLLCSLLVIFSVFHQSNAEQLCLESCRFDHSFDGNFTIPLNCTIGPREQCAATMTFDYTNRVVHMLFGNLSKSVQSDAENYTTDNVIHTSIGLDGDSSTEHVIEYYCSSGDLCERNYVLDEALPQFLKKTCFFIRTKLIALLRADPSVKQRACMIADGEEVICDKQCELFYQAPGKVKRDCDNQRNLEFQTTVGYSTPINKPEYQYRLFAYACTTPACNAYTTQAKIEKLLREDDGECLVGFNSTIEPTTTIVIPTTAIATAMPCSFDLMRLFFISIVAVFFR